LVIQPLELIIRRFVTYSKSEHQQFLEKTLWLLMELLNFLYLASFYLE